jgi:uncharacterized protein (DUF488 family)
MNKLEKIYTIGFTKKTAQSFFEICKINKIDFLIDIRLKNISQLSGFAKYPDIQYFLNQICGIHYIHDICLAPTEEILKKYKGKEITWDEYVCKFQQEMNQREISNYIINKYAILIQKKKNLCLLCSEAIPENCHRSLIAKYFSDAFHLDVIDL